MESETTTTFDEWTQHEDEAGHQIRYPTTATMAEQSRNATLRTADGTAVTVGDDIAFERFPECPYRLQAFHDIQSPDHCFADFHFDQNAQHDAVFVSGFDMSWTRLATLLDSGAAQRCDPANPD